MQLTLIKEIVAGFRRRFTSSLVLGVKAPQARQNDVVFRDQELDVLCPWIFERLPLALNVYEAVEFGSQAIDGGRDCVGGLKRDFVRLGQGSDVFVVEVLVHARAKQFLREKTENESRPLVHKQKFPIHCMTRRELYVPKHWVGWEVVWAGDRLVQAAFKGVRLQESVVEVN